MAPATSLLREAQNWKPRWRKLQCSAQSHPKSAFSFLHLVLDVASCHLNGRWCQDFTYTLDNYMYEYMINTHIYILYTFPRFEVYSHDYQWYFVKWVKRPGHLVPGGSSLGAGWFGVDPAGLAGNHHLVGILWLDLLHFWGSRVFFWSKPRRGEILGHLGWNLLRLTGDDPMIPPRAAGELHGPIATACPARTAAIGPVARWQRSGGWSPIFSWFFWVVYPLVNSHITIENHHFQWENPLFLWPCSIATLNYQRVGKLKWVCHGF